MLESSSESTVVTIVEAAEVEVAEVIYCWSCGKESPTDAQFCTKCGKLLRAPQEWVDWATKYLEEHESELTELDVENINDLFWRIKANEDWKCPNCSRMNSAKSRFCTNCGEDRNRRLSMR